MKKFIYISFLLSALLLSCTSYTEEIRLECKQPVIPVLTHKPYNPVLQLRLIRQQAADYRVEKIVLALTGTTDPEDIETVSLFLSDPRGNFSTEHLLGTSDGKDDTPTFHLSLPVDKDTLTLWASVRLKETVAPDHRVALECQALTTDQGPIRIPSSSHSSEGLRVGVALRQQGDDGVESCRIPGLATSRKGTLIALYDARRESDRDLQGDIDIAINRSTDGGKTWSPMQVVLDRGRWGGLPERYNGVSDACILSDDRTGDLYVFGLWMHGVLDSKTGRWIEGLTDTSTVWNHQWRSFGSQPGYDIKRTAQFLMTKSTDDGLTWSEPVNLTRQVKDEAWWLIAPAPGRGITLSDGTLAIPAEGRDRKGVPFSTVIWSKDRGNTWHTGNPAYTNTNECAVVELSDHSLMLNMRERSNRGRMEGNGRAVAVTRDSGRTWTEHPSSRKALIEPACMASLHRHFYTENGKRKSVLFFLNPSSRTSRNTFTIKTSFDDGLTWPESYWLLIDEWNGNGYSCLTSIDEHTLGVLYEGSQADMTFMQIPVTDLLKKQNHEKKSN